MRSILFTLILCVAAHAFTFGVTDNNHNAPAVQVTRFVAGEYSSVNRTAVLDIQLI